ncbi:MAG: TIGR03960 family B12-binding radical SAM protein, partial [Firmicutes bacterium]|nr:TIGR03960 family B12-binding radical SAM protein [Bacillota bacterium]
MLKRVEKPGRYIGGEVNSVKKSPEDTDVNFCFCFPDIYEIGMSYLGLQILYKAVNDRKGLYCQRAFHPQEDMEQLMRQENVPLYTLETKTPLKDLDCIGFTLQYEMSFTTMLNMMDLSGIPVFSRERGDDMPLVIAGGPCATNPEPLWEFVDCFIIGDGEEALPDFLEELGRAKKNGMSKGDFLRLACRIPGVYVPAFYDVEYNEDGTILRYVPLVEEAPMTIRRNILPSIEDAVFPVDPIIPMVEAVHDRAVVETFRGCTRGCRFCQAGMIYRPVRERSVRKINEIAYKQLRNTGHEELSLLSLSSSDHSRFEELALGLLDMTKPMNVSLSLPSLRMDKFAFDVLDRIQEYRKSSLTYAPEAGTQRLRDIINKGVTENDIYESVREALTLGWNHIKLYFMDGLPGETYEDLDGIAEIARKIMDINYEVRGRKGGRFRVTVSVS